MNRPDYYRPKDGPIKLLAVLLGVLSLTAFALFAFGAQTASLSRQSRQDMQTKPLATVEQPCQLELTVEYDKEPIDAVLISPSGIRFAKEDLSAYADTGTSLKLNLVTEETGDWQIEYNQKSNRDLNLTVNQSYADQIFLRDLETWTSPAAGDLYLQFTPLYQDGSDTETTIHCSITAEQFSMSHSALVYNGTLPVNKQAKIQLDMKSLPSDQYRLWIHTSSDDKNPAFQAKKQLTVTWENKYPEPTETESETEPETTQETESASEE